jgi:pipecolate-incorporating enzyme
VLAFVVHHIAFDRESLQIFASEFSDAYASFRAGSAPELPALRWQYADFAAWQRTDCSPAALDRQIRYWKRRLAGAPLVLALPADHPRPAQPSPRAGAVPLAVSRVAAMSLRRLGQQHGLTMFALTMAAYHAVLARYAGNPDIVVGCGINTRARARAERMIGFFANSVAIRADASGDLPFLQLARRVGDALLDAFENQELPFEHLVERLRPERDLSRYPIIQTWFECISTGPVPDPTVPSLPDIRATPFATALVRTRFDLEAHLHTGDGTLSGRIIYADALFDRTTMLRFANHFMNFLESAAARPNDPLSRIEMIGAEERHQIINEWGTAAVTRR